jgi:hypothetical protein
MACDEAAGAKTRVSASAQLTCKESRLMEASESDGEN